MLWIHHFTNGWFNNFIFPRVLLSSHVVLEVTSNTFSYIISHLYPPTKINRYRRGASARIGIRRGSRTREDLDLEGQGLPES